MEDVPATPARERIVTAAATVMRERGIANATTKSIAAAAGYSEAMLYKHFADKQELFLAVLKERLPPIAPQLILGGGDDLVTDLATIAEHLMTYYTEAFPISASLFGAPELLAMHRDGIRRHGVGGPSGPVLMVQRHLDAERAAGRIRANADTESAARLLVGAAFQQGFLAAYEGLDSVPDAPAISRGLADQLATVLSPDR